jgi:glycosyltransferase involved in cell wall biosynthesis|tara:strand:- start:259 stop:1317 length:1059 start_codon:yes stop_codon:yes gene_type:complete
MKIIIAYGSKGKFFHMKQFSNALKELGVECMLVQDSDYSTGFPSKKILELIPNNKFKNLINTFKPDAIFVDKQSHFGLDAIKRKIPLFILLRGHYWLELEWAKKTIHNNFKDKTILWFKNRTAEKCFEQASAIFPISNYLVDVIKKYHPNQNTPVFFEGIDHLALDSSKKMELKHPCVGLLQDANVWGKTKEMLILKKVLRKMPNLNFYWAGDGNYTKKIVEELEEFENFRWLGRLQYPEEVSKFLSSIDVYALISGMDLAPLTLKEAQLMEKPVIATNVGGIYEIMEDGKTGFLIKENDPEDLIEKLTVLFSDKNLREKMGINGKQFVIEKFNWNAIAKKFIGNIKQYIKN